MTLFGLVLGAATLVIIGLGFPLVIQGERLFGYLWWPYMMGLGAATILVTILIRNDWLAVLVGVLGATLVWGSTELKEQAVRAELGWYPFNPKKLTPPLVRIIRTWRAPHL